MGKERRLLWGYIDRNGEYVIAPRFDDAWDFHEDLAAVKVEWARGYIDRKGEFVIAPRFEKAGDFHGGVAKVMIDGEWTYIDRNGEPARPSEDPAAALRSDAPAEGPFPKNEDGKTGYVDENGEWVIKPMFHDAGPFREGLARARKGKTSKWGYIDRSGDFVIKGVYEGAEDFHDGLARVLARVETE